MPKSTKGNIWSAQCTSGRIIEARVGRSLFHKRLSAAKRMFRQGMQAIVSIMVHAVVQAFVNFGGKSDEDEASELSIEQTTCN